LLTYTDKGSTVKHKIKEMQANVLTYTDRVSAVKHESKSCITNIYILYVFNYVLLNLIVEFLYVQRVALWHKLYVPSLKS